MGQVKKTIEELYEGLDQLYKNFSHIEASESHLFIKGLRDNAKLLMEGTSE